MRNLILYNNYESSKSHHIYTRENTELRIISSMELHKENYLKTYAEDTFKNNQGHIKRGTWEVAMGCVACLHRTFGDMKGVLRPAGSSAVCPFAC